MIKCFELHKKECQGYTNSLPLCHITNFGLINAYLGGRNLRGIS